MFINLFFELNIYLKLKNENQNILNKLKYEKDQRTKNEAYNKFK